MITDEDVMSQSVLVGPALPDEQMDTFAWWTDSFCLVVKPIWYVRQALDCF